jgi:nucleoside-diphosphate-sugar epimerase
MKENNRKNVLVIGGTGIVGRPTVLRLIEGGEYIVHSIALDCIQTFPESVRQHIVDRTTDEYIKLITELTSEVGTWDAVIDIIAFNIEAAKTTYSLLKDHSKHIVILSTTLVYDRMQKNDDPITENTFLAHKGDFGGYVDGKVELEKFWHTVSDVNWTIVRPYHILGGGSLLGCIPEHNRDPHLIDLLKGGILLKLFKGGETQFNYIHSKDVAAAFCHIIGNTRTFCQAYNLVNPDIITAKEYYAEIARQVGGSLIIEDISIEKIWNDKKGWEMTTFPHIYSMDKMRRDISFTPRISLNEAISDAITHPSENTSRAIPVHDRMNKLPHPNRPTWLE